MVVSILYKVKVMKDKIYMRLYADLLKHYKDKRGAVVFGDIENHTILVEIKNKKLAEQEIKDLSGKEMMVVRRFVDVKISGEVN